jgi:hypothetical protein
VRNADRAVDGTLVHDRFEHRDLAFRLSQLESVAVRRDDAGGVVTAILQALEAFDQQPTGRLRPDVANNSTHKYLVRRK